MSDIVGKCHYCPIEISDEDSQAVMVCFRGQGSSYLYCSQWCADMDKINRPDSKTSYNVGG